MIDLAHFDDAIEVSFDVPIAFDDQGAPSAGFKVVGKNSTRYREVDRKLSITSVKKAMTRGTKAVDAKTDAGATQFVDDVAARELAVAIACTVDWYGFTKGGEVAPLTPEVLCDVFTKRPTWLAKVSAAIASDENFSRS